MPLKLLYCESRQATFLHHPHLALRNPRFFKTYSDGPNGAYWKTTENRIFKTMNVWKIRKALWVTIA